MIILDGPVGTLLAARGIPTPPPRWSVAALDTHPEAIAGIHAAYAHAGATVHTAVTFRAHARTVGPDAPRLVARAVSLARGAIPAGHRVAGSHAPLEDCYRPDLSPPHPAAEHRAHADRLADAGVDLVLVETFPHPGEALVATRAAVATGLPVWSALTPGYRGDLLEPTLLAESATRLAEAGAEVVLVNCLPAAKAAPWVEALAATGLPWGIYANAGAPSDRLAHGTPGAGARYGALAAAWALAGASVIGGCCGTGPEHVAAIATLAKNR